MLMAPTMVLILPKKPIPHMSTQTRDWYKGPKRPVLTVLKLQACMHMAEAEAEAELTVQTCMQMAEAEAEAVLTLQTCMQMAEAVAVQSLHRKHECKWLSPK